jgi:hypothetical protein
VAFAERFAQITVMGVHLLAIDLDGTLLNSAKQVTEATAAILRAARQQAGVQVVLATARPPRSVMPIYRLLDLDTPMINYNGALVYDPASGRVLMHRPIPLATARLVVSTAREVLPEVIVSGEVLDRWYTDRFEPALAARVAGVAARPHVVAPLEQWLTRPVTKLLLLGAAEAMPAVLDAVRTRLPYEVVTVQTEDFLVQVMHSTVSKAQALRMVAGELGVAQSQVMAIGDNLNDIDMLRWAGVAVAMGNAPAAVRKVADHVTDHHDADGAANAIQSILLG